MENKCLYCQRDSQEIPLILLEYRGKALAICPEHLPILIHKPEQLEEILAGLAKSGYK